MTEIEIQVFNDLYDATRFIEIHMLPALVKEPKVKAEILRLDDNRYRVAIEVEKW